MTTEHGGSFVIQSSSMELCGKVLDNLCSYLKIQELESVADFPDEMTRLSTFLSELDEYRAIRSQLSTDIADSANLVKTLIVRGEDARIIGNHDQMLEFYQELHNLNQELIGEHNKRATNHAKLLECLHEINFMIQKAAQVRVGEPKSRVVSACRKALKSRNIPALFKTMKTGASA